MAENTENNVVQFGITVDDGLRRVPITNTLGDEIGVFYFRPTDIGIIKRFNTMAERFDDITKPLEALGVDSDGKDDSLDESQMEALKEAEKRLYEAVNELFDSDAAGAFFGKMNPFSPVNGVFYCETVLQAVGEFINKQFETETAKFSKRVEKYTRRGKK